MLTRQTDRLVETYICACTDTVRQTNCHKLTYEHVQTGRLKHTTSEHILTETYIDRSMRPWKGGPSIPYPFNYLEKYPKSLK